MDNQNQRLLHIAIDSATALLEALHKLAGRMDAQADFRPELRFVDDDPKELPFPGNAKKPLPEQAEAIFLERTDDPGEPSVKQGIIYFTTKEINLMPKKFRTQFNIDGRWVTLRKRIRGKTSCSFEIRYRRHGYNVSVSAKSEDLVRQRFIEKINQLENGVQTPKVPNTFHEFAMFYFENYRKRKVAELTFKFDVQKYNNHLRNVFQSMPLRAINNEMCQAIIDKYNDKGQRKTAKELSSLLSGIFNYAVNHGIIPRNPIKLVINQPYESKHGVAFTKEEEKIFLQSLEGTPYQVGAAVVLFCGLRPCEYKTARLEGEFIVAVNAKRKNGKVEYKRIPISPMLAPFLEGKTSLNMPSERVVERLLKNVLPHHTLKDMRTTFNTRCEEFHVEDLARRMFMGHSLEILRRTYTDLPDSWFLAELKKIRY